jgi:hypothetical protein
MRRDMHGETCGIGATKKRGQKPEVGKKAATDRTTEVRGRKQVARWVDEALRVLSDLWPLLFSSVA